MSQHPHTAPLPTPAVPTVHSAPVTIMEWRLRRESRSNAIMVTGTAVFVEATVLRTGWFALLALTVAVALVVASILLRPTLPWRIPRGAIGSATGTDHEGQPTTGENPMFRDPRSGSAIPGAPAPASAPPPSRNPNPSTMTAASARFAPTTSAHIDSFPVAAPIGTRRA